MEITLTEPIPTTEERVAALELAVAEIQAFLGTASDSIADLNEQAVQLRDRLSLLETTASVGLADLGRALAELEARRPPVRRKLREVEERLEAAGIPPVPESTVTEPTPGEV